MQHCPPDSPARQAAIIGGHTGSVLRGTGFVKALALGKCIAGELVAAGTKALRKLLVLFLGIKGAGSVAGLDAGLVATTVDTRVHGTTIFIACSESIFSEARHVLVTAAFLNTAPVSIRTASANTFAHCEIRLRGFGLGIPETELTAGRVVIAAALQAGSDVVARRIGAEFIVADPVGSAGVCAETEIIGSATVLSLPHNRVNPGAIGIDPGLI